MPSLNLKGIEDNSYVNQLTDQNRRLRELVGEQRKNLMRFVDLNIRGERPRWLLKNNIEKLLRGIELNKQRLIKKLEIRDTYSKLVFQLDYSYMDKFIEIMVKFNNKLKLECEKLKEIFENLKLSEEIKVTINIWIIIIYNNEKIKYLIKVAFDLQRIYSLYDEDYFERRLSVKKLIFILIA